MSSSLCTALFVMSLAPGLVRAQAVPSANEGKSETPAGSHLIEISAGLLSAGRSTVAVSGTGVNAEASGRGVLGSIRYAYWVDDDLAFQVTAGFLNADAGVYVSGTGATVRSATVVPLLIGVKYQPFEFGSFSDLRPYAYGSLGPYLGYEAGVEAGWPTQTGTRWESALGVRLAAGLDLSLSHLFTLGFQLGYMGMTDFENPIGGERNYSGPEFSLSLGLMIGS